MSAEAAILSGRQAAESLMWDWCQARRPPVAGDIDPDTGTREEVLGEVSYEGRCKVQTYEAHESTPKSGEHVFTVQRYYVHLPVTTSAGVWVNDSIGVVTRRDLLAAGLDPSREEDLDLIRALPPTRRYRVAGTLEKSYQTANRLIVDLITG